MGDRSAVGLPKLPCCSGVGASPPPEVSPVEPGLRELNPAALRCGVGKWGAPNSAVKVAARPQNINCRLREGDYADPTHWRNRHGPCRDGKGGALDALTPSESEVEDGAEGATP